MGKKFRAFQRDMTGTELFTIIIGFAAASTTIFQNVFSNSTFALGVEQTITKQPINFWNFLLAILLFISLSIIMKKLKKR